MTGKQVLAVLKQILDARYIIGGTMILTGILDLLGITLGDFGSGFVFGSGILVLSGVVDYLRQNKKTKK